MKNPKTRQRIAYAALGWVAVLAASIETPNRSEGGAPQRPTLISRLSRRYFLVRLRPGFLA